MESITAFLSANLLTAMNGLAMGLLLFVLAVGLSLVFGLMGVLNLAHGSLFLLGAYIAYQLLAADGPLLVLPLACAAGAACGLGLAAISGPLMRRGPFDPAMVTLGLAFAAGDVLPAIWGRDVKTVTPAAGLGTDVRVLGHPYPLYRLLLIGIGLLIAFAMYFGIERTRIGALVRACVADRAMVAALGVRTGLVLYGVFALGAALATVAGVLGSPILGASPGLDDEVLLLALIVVVTGGLGSFRGTMIAALVVGEVRSLGVALLPQYASFLLFGAMALVLILRPSGLAAAPETVGAR